VFLSAAAASADWESLYWLSYGDCVFPCRSGSSPDLGRALPGSCTPAQVARAVADGHDVRGFYYWTLCDNYEWHLGYNMK
jgi:hypothetical protein